MGSTSSQHRLATKSEQERQDEEAERLVRPAPKLKPPRRDKRRERVDTDPDEERDPDESLNYKDIGGSVLRRWAKSKLITVRDKKTGKPVNVSPEGLKKNPGKYEEIKKDEEDKPEEKKPFGQPPKEMDLTLDKERAEHDEKVKKEEAEEAKAQEAEKAEKDKADAEEKAKSDEEKAKAEAKEKAEKEATQTEAEKAGIGEPQQREASEAEYMAANDLIMDTFPPEVATDLLARNMHPDDVAEVVNAYHVSKAMPVGSDVGAFADKAAKFYETDPSRIPPPATGRNASGKEVPFEELEPEEKATAYREFQNRIVAASLAAESKLTNAFSMPNRAGQARVPRELAAAMSSAVLGKTRPPATIEGKDGKEVKWTDLDEKQQKRALKQLESKRINEALEKAHDAALKSGPISDSVAKKLLGSVKGDAAKVAKTFLMADDFETARGKFLGREGVTEFSKPSEIVKELDKADKFFAERAKVYGEDKHGSAAAFRQKVVSQLRSLDRAKYNEVQGLLDRKAAKAYDKALVKHEKDLAAWEKRKKAWEKEQPFGNTYRGKPFEEPQPAPPRKPPRYALTLKPAEAAKEGRRFFDRLLNSVAQKMPDKTAARVTQKFISTYSSGEAMAHFTDKSSVYHGVDPAENDPGPYDGWSQVHSRDISEASLEAILTAARDWLTQPVLARPVEGYERDTQLRAALDLGLKTSGYDRHVSPPLYDTLLARLAGRPTPPMQTLTKLADRTSSCPPLQEVTLMKPSQELRKLAAEAAEANPKLAYDLHDLADRIDAEPAPSTEKVASGDDKFAQLRSLVIRTAASDADAKKVLMPVLQAVKDLG